MYHRTRVAALHAGLRYLGIDIDPEELDNRARELGIKLPIESGMVSAPSIGNTAFAHRIPLERHGELRAAVAQVMAASKRAA
jgi:hypothetical protein